MKVGPSGADFVKMLLHNRLSPCLRTVLANDRIGLHGQGFADVEVMLLHGFVGIVLFHFVGSIPSRDGAFS